MARSDLVKIKARDVRPYKYALWCTVDGREIDNEIVVVKWSEDGEKIWMMLETHNFHSALPDEELELVLLPPSQYRKEDTTWTLGPRPEKKETPEDWKKRALEAEAAVTELKEELAEQARIVGAGGEREAKLRTELAMARKALVDVVRELDMTRRHIRDSLELKGIKVDE